jgi:pseudaminic acid cytidylyltransferase
MACSSAIEPKSNLPAARVFGIRLQSKLSRITAVKVAIIPARGGSKRIPHKNVKLFAGKPIIAYSIMTARRSGCFDRIIVSTDDEEIAGVAKEWDAEVPFMRPKELSDDHTMTKPVIKHAIDWLQNNWASPKYVCCLYATAPFVQTRFLREGLAKLEASDKSFAFTVTSFPFPIQRAVRINSRGEIEALWPEHELKRSQDLEETFHDAGQFYWGHTEAFLTDVACFSPASLPVKLPRHLVQDIDTPEDWHRAELMYRALLESGELEE